MKTFVLGLVVVVGIMKMCIRDSCRISSTSGRKVIPGSRSILHRKNGEGNMNDLNSKKMKKIYIGLFWACILGITGCYEDDSTMATPESMVNEIKMCIRDRGIPAPGNL